MPVPASPRAWWRRGTAGRCVSPDQRRRFAQVWRRWIGAAVGWRGGLQRYGLGTAGRRWGCLLRCGVVEADDFAAISASECYGYALQAAEEERDVSRQSKCTWRVVCSHATPLVRWQ
eukprot:5316299-Prymnesium_polylepis.1